VERLLEPVLLDVLAQLAQKVDGIVVEVELPTLRRVRDHRLDRRIHEDRLVLRAHLWADASLRLELL
tara:strand:+ start:2183 stop:2383 length:201 start_codon:yes stop_codon:yes gene_type:complete